jgi:hypothetical protein
MRTVVFASAIAVAALATMAGPTLAAETDQDLAHKLNNPISAHDQHARTDGVGRHDERRPVEHPAQLHRREGRQVRSVSGQLRGRHRRYLDSPSDGPEWKLRSYMTLLLPGAK